MLKERSNEIIVPSPLTGGGETIKVDAWALSHRELNAKLRGLVSNGAQRIELHNVYGQRYIGTDLGKPVEIEIFGTPGNDLGAFMDGPRIIVHGNAQDGCGNTMNSGEIIIHGHAGDILGLSARGGKIFVREDVGYRAGIHMKEYQGKKPMVIIGGTAQDFLGEYMAGGILILLGLNLEEGERHKANFIGTGMHGGVIYMRGEVQEFQLGKEVGVAELDENDYLTLKGLVGEFASHFDYDAEELLRYKYTKLFPLYLRPYGRLYAY
jgi:glutamate synthase domain-containing protein 3